MWKYIFSLWLYLGAYCYSAEIPSIYRCIGSYSIPPEVVYSGFCNDLIGMDDNLERIALVEEVAMAYDLSDVKCDGGLDKLIAGVLFRYYAESSNSNSLKDLENRKEFVNEVVDSKGRKINPAGVAAICGYAENLEYLIGIGAKPFSNLKLEVHSNGEVIQRQFSLIEALYFNDAINSRYEILPLEKSAEVFERVEGLLRAATKNKRTD